MVVSLRGLSFLALLFFFSGSGSAAQTSWVADEHARDIAASAIRPIYPEPCYSTYRDERLENFVWDIGPKTIVGGQINKPVYFYHVASDSCNYVTMENGKPVVHTQVSMDCCEYGIVAVGRVTSKSYWFSERGKKAGDIFKDFVRDENLRPDSSQPVLFSALYRELVWGQTNATEISSLRQLRDLVQSNFQSAYSPYERDNAWQPKFEKWWRQFQAKIGGRKLETSYESLGVGTIVRGYGFSGFQLTIPRTDPPPKGTPTLFQWTFSIRPDGTVEEQPSRVVYSRR